MKRRTGFVSNSSSSSFMIVGKWISERPNNYRDLESAGIEYYEANEDGPCIGVRFHMEDSETWGEYKAKVAKRLMEAGIPVTSEDIRVCYGECNDNS